MPIEPLPYEECVRHYDKPDTFFFLDPPYRNANPCAYAGWTLEQMEALGRLLPTLKGPWILTVDDSRDTRAIFKPFNQRLIAFDNKLVPNIGRKVMMRELVITSEA